MTIRILLNEFDSQRSAELEQALTNAGYQVAGKFTSDKNLLMMVDQLDPDLIVIDVDEAFDGLMRSLKQLNDLKPKPIVIFSDKGDRDVIRAAVNAGVSSFIVDGLTARRIQPVITVALERFKQTQSLKDELYKVKTTLAERKIIEKAKGIVMKQRNINEESAFKILRKAAMNTNKTLIDIAENIITVSEMLES